MINTLADLLKDFSEKENERLCEMNIKHPPTIGAMYEGLTAEILHKSLFEGLGLVVAKSSFIKGSYTEFDVILAEGEGVPIPHTDKYEFAPEQVLAVIQVKKTLNTKEMKDSYENLKCISDLYVNIDAKDYMYRLATHSVHHTLQRSVEDYQVGKLSLEDEYIYHSLVTEAQLPVTIVIGYNGLKSEDSLREKFYEYLTGMVSCEGEVKKGYGPNNFPSLLICEGNTIVKMLGTPYNAPLKQSPMGWWNFLASSHYNPMYFFLDTLWSKLSYRYGLPSEIFGEDLETPKMAPFLSCRISKQGDMLGWNYHYFPYGKDDLNSINGTVEWQPAFLNKTQFYVMTILCEVGKMDLSQIPDLEKDAQEEGYQSLDEFIQSLCNAGIVVRIDDKRIRLLTDDCQVMMIDDMYIMAENNSGRFGNWLEKHMGEFMPWMKKT